MSFTLLTERDVPEINAHSKLFVHDKTGARLLSLTCDDENKSFGITFRKPPSDSTGIAHIMEHSVLCGSHKYPVKEPFVELLKGSLHTYLNAFTYPDKTCYPCASQNLKDFYNLIDVYFDAVFHPLDSRAYTSTGTGALGWMQHVKTGSLRLLLIIESERIERMADVPTFKKGGYNFETPTAQMVSAPNCVPRPIIDRLI